MLSELYNKEAKKIRHDPQNYSLSGLSSTLKKMLEEKANDERFKVGLKDLTYQPSGGNKSLRYFFSTLCDYNRWHEEGENGKPYANKEHIINYDNVTIEHIDSCMETCNFLLIPLYLQRMIFVLSKGGITVVL